MSNPVPVRNDKPYLAHLAYKRRLKRHQMSTPAKRGS